VSWESLAAVVAYTIVFLFAAIRAYDPAKGMMMRKGG